MILGFNENGAAVFTFVSAASKNWVNATGAGEFLNESGQLEVRSAAFVSVIQQLSAAGLQVLNDSQVN